MQSKQVLELLDHERRTLFTAGTDGQVSLQLTRVQGVGENDHQISFSALSEHSADAVIAEQVAHFRRLRQELEWTAYAHDAPRDLLQRLARHGFEIGEREAVMVCDLREQPSWLGALPQHTVLRVTTLEQLQIYQRVAESIFGDSQTGILRELRAALACGSTQHIAYLGFDDALPAVVARLHTHPSSSFAGLYGGGTLEPHRGRGLYRAMVAQRARDALQLGVRYLRVDALPTSQPILEQLGFVELTQTWPCRLKPAG